MAQVQLAPPPEYLVEREQKTNAVTDKITQVFRLWLLSLTTAIQAATKVLKTVTLTGQIAAIGSTSVPLGTLSAGSYRLTFYARITTPATTSSSLTVTIGWTDGGIACAHTFTAITGNTASTTGSESYTVRADQGTLLTYSTAYASVGGVVMAYRLDVIAEQVG